MSHEQLNPLNSIINFTHYLHDWTINVLKQYDPEIQFDDDMSLDSSESQSLESSDPVSLDKCELMRQLKIIKIVGNSSRMMQLLNLGMLNLSKIQQQTLCPEYQPINDLFPVLHEFIAIFQQFIHQKKLKLQMTEEVFGDLQTVEKLQGSGVMIDLSIYQQILYNVFMNACKFNKMNGKIKVSVSASSVKVQQQKEKLRVVTHIEDNGQGMSKSQLKKLFKVFESIRKASVHKLDHRSSASLEQTSPGVTSGCGLGLHLSMQLAKFFDGDIDIESI